MPTHSNKEPFGGAKGCGKGGGHEVVRRVTTVSFGKREKSEKRRRRKCWVMNYRADHFRLTPEREWGGEGGALILLLRPVRYVGSHRGEQFMAN